MPLPGQLTTQPFLRDGTLTPQQQSSLNRRYLYEQFKAQPLCMLNSGAALPTGTAGDINVMHTNHNIYEYFIVGTQTIVAPRLGAVSTGLDFSLDNANGDGVEFAPSGTLLSGKFAYTIGTDAPFFMRQEFTIEDVSGAPVFIMGFRKAAQAFQTAYTSYTDYAVIGIVASAATAKIQTKTRDDSGTAVTTDTTQTWSDTASHVIGVYVDRAGNVTYTIDGAAPTVSVTAALDNGDTYIPFWRYENGADVAGAVTTSLLEIGIQGARGNNPR